MRQAVKDLFAAHDLPCVSEGDVLVFTDKGHGDDFACMWEIILALLRSRWFLDCASSFVWEMRTARRICWGKPGRRWRPIFLDKATMRRYNEEKHMNGRGKG